MMMMMMRDEKKEERERRDVYIPAHSLSLLSVMGLEPRDHLACGEHLFATTKNHNSYSNSDGNPKSDNSYSNSNGKFTIGITMEF